MHPGASKFGWAKYYDYYNQYDISKYVLNFSYYEHTKEFGTNQVAKVKKLSILVGLGTAICLAGLLIELICCIVIGLNTNNPYCFIGIPCCLIWFFIAIGLVFVMHAHAKKYYKVIDLLMGNGSLSPVAVQYPKIVYTMLWYFHEHPMWWGQWMAHPGLVPQTWYGYNKSLALFIDRLNEYYLNHNEPNKQEFIINQ